MKKILVVCKGHRNIAGAQLYLKQIAVIFPQRDYEIYFALQKSDGLRFIEEISSSCRTQIVDYDWRHLPFGISFKLARTIYSRIKPDLIIYNSSEDKILAPIWASRSFKSPKKVMIVHWAQSERDLPLFSKRRIAGIPIPSRYSIKTRAIRAQSYNALDHLVFVNQMTRRAYTKLYRLKPSKCTTIYNGVDLSAFSKAEKRAEVRCRLDLAPSDIMLLSTGNLTAVKGHSCLISAVASLVAKGMKIKCFLAGQGELEGQLARQIADLGLSSSVKLLGYRNDVAELLSACDLFCMPSLNEALGYSLIEAMAAGKPVVASGVGGIPEVITTEREGLLVNPGDVEALSDAIERVLTNGSLMESLKQNALQKVKAEFSIETMRTSTKALFEKILNASEK